MHGAHSLVQTLADGGVEVCFVNPGTTESHLLDAFEQVKAIRPILGLFEAVCTGAADGYARMTGRPAATIMHHGAGLAYGLPNLHNARRARSPVVNIVGDNTTAHLKNDPPLASDIEALARTVGWVRTCRSAADTGATAAAALVAARSCPGQIATIVLPADCAWDEGGVPGRVAPPSTRPKPSAAAVSAAGRVLASKEPTILYLGGEALTEQGLRLAGRIAKAAGARVMANRVNPRTQRGAGRLIIERLPYQPAAALKMMGNVRHLILIGARDPISFYAWPGQVRSQLYPENCQLHVLADEAADSLAALEALASEVRATDSCLPLDERHAPPLPTGPLTLESIWQALNHLMPEQAIISDEGISSSRMGGEWTMGAAPHDWLNLSGGAIGQGMPVATGAAVACPGRKVFSLQSDGAGVFAPQALWTQARKRLDVITIIFANRAYKILHAEFNAALGRKPGPQVQSLLDLNDPDLDWVKVAQGFGVEATRAATSEEFNRQLAAAVKNTGPHLIEALL